MKLWLVCFALLCLPPLWTPAFADIVYLNNGHQIEGEVISESPEEVVLAVNNGQMRFAVEEIQSIELGTRQELTYLKQTWHRQNEHYAEQMAELQMNQLGSEDHDFAYEQLSSRTKKVPFSLQGSSMFVQVKINGKGPMSFLLDTGCSTTLLPRSYAKTLNLNLNKGEDIEVQVADGRTVSGRKVTLSKVDLNGAKVSNVEAHVLSSEVAGSSQALLGMSFLNHFKFSIDRKQKLLILKPLK